MQSKTKKELKKELVKKLQRELKEAKAQLVHQYHFASLEIDRMSFEKMMGSAVILTLESLGGSKTCGPVAIREGLSPETIAAIKNDLKRSYETAIEFKP